MRQCQIETFNSERESINFKLPKTLTKALRAAARERNTTATDERVSVRGLNEKFSTELQGFWLLVGLHHILGQVTGIETSIETRLHKLETQLTLVATRIDVRVEDSVDDGLKQRLSLLEQQYEAIATPVDIIFAIRSYQHPRVIPTVSTQTKFVAVPVPIDN